MRCRGIPDNHRQMYTNYTRLAAWHCHRLLFQPQLRCSLKLLRTKQRCVTNLYEEWCHMFTSDSPRVCWHRSGCTRWLVAEPKCHGHFTYVHKWLYLLPSGSKSYELCRERIKWLYIEWPGRDHEWFDRGVTMNGATRLCKHEWFDQGVTVNSSIREWPWMVQPGSDHEWCDQGVTVNGATTECREWCDHGVTVNGSTWEWPWMVRPDCVTVNSATRDIILDGNGDRSWELVGMFLHEHTGWNKSPSVRSRQESATNDLGWTKLLTRIFHMKWLNLWYISPEI